ncbi:hypothetical protein D047_3107A, partial [Vibrio parahaemolyticus VPTS-2010_2]|jgi:hypothetical protein
MARV